MNRQPARAAPAAASGAKGPALATRGRVEQLLAATAAGAPMQSRGAVELLRGVGIAGDRYALGKGHWSDSKWPDQELTLLAGEVAREIGVEPLRLRRNVVTSGVDLAALAGRRFRIGAAGVIVEGVRPCDPCAYIEGFVRRGIVGELRGFRGGLRARIVAGGWIHTGDEIELFGAPLP